VANRYWVGGTGDWNATAGSKWSTTSGGAGGSAAPTAADDVYIDLGSGSVTVTVPASTTVVCRSLNFVDGTGGAFTGTFVMAATTSIITIGDGTAGAGNNALKIASGMTWTNTAVGTINFISTSATQQTITTAGKTMPSMVINGVGSSYVLGDALTQVITGTSTVFILQAGTFDTANYTCTFLIFNTTGAAAKTLTLGSSLLNIYRNASAMDFSGTLPTITANTASFVFKANATMNPAGLNMNGASLTFESVGGTFNHQNGGTWANLTVVSGIIFYLQNAGVTVTGTFTANGAAANNRLLIASIARGASKTITAATVTVTNADFMDIDGAGAGDWDLSAITGLSGDCGGNSGITFTTPVTQTATGTSSFTWSTHGWTTRVPLPQDDVVIPNAFVAGRTITADRPRMGKNITCTCTGSPNFLFSAVNEIYGSLTMASGMTATRTETLTFAGRGTYTITSNGVTFANAIAFNAPTGTYTLQDDFTTTNTLTLTSGTLDTNNHTVTSTTFAATGAVTRALTLGTSTYNLTGLSSTIWNAVATGLTLSASSSTIIISTASAAARGFTSGGQVYGTITYTVANSTGALTVAGSSTYGTINLAPSRALIPNATGNYTITGSITGSGSPTSYIYMGGDSYGASIPDSAATSIANDIDIRLRVALDDVDLVGGKRIAGKYGAAGQRSWRIFILSGFMVFETSSDGTNTAVAAQATQKLGATGLSSGTTYWLRVARDKAAGTVKFYYAADSTSVPSGGSWTQIGSTISGVSTTAIFDSTSITTVGGEISGTNSNPGKYYRMQVCSNLADDGSAIQADIDFTAKTFGADTFTESSSNAATVTMANSSVYGDGRIQISTSASGSAAILTKPSGGPITTTSDYLVVKDMSVTQPLSFFAGANSVNVSGNSGIYFTNSTYKHVQSGAAASVSGTTITATYPTATTSGNLLIAYFTSSNSQGTYTPPAGWTLAKSSSVNVLVYIYYKIADGTETSVAFSQTTSRTLNVTLVEYTGFSGTPTLDVTDSNGAAGAATTLSTTATTGPTNTAQPALALAFLANASTLNTTTGLTNSFVEDRTLQTASSVQKGAVKELTTTAAVDTTFSWTTSRSGTAVALVVFINTNSFIPQTVFFS